MVFESLSLNLTSAISKQFSEDDFQRDLPLVDVGLRSPIQTSRVFHTSSLVRAEVWTLQHFGELHKFGSRKVPIFCCGFRWISRNDRGTLYLRPLALSLLRNELYFGISWTVSQSLRTIVNSKACCHYDMVPRLPIQVSRDYIIGDTMLRLRPVVP